MLSGDSPKLLTDRDANTKTPILKEEHPHLRKWLIKENTRQAPIYRH